MLSDADLDHTLGLFLLRESNWPVSIHASLAIQNAVEEGLRITEILNFYCGVHWVIAPSNFEPLRCREGMEIGLEYRAFGIMGPGPRYSRSHHRSCRLFYVIRECATGKSVLLAPAVAQLEPRLLAELSRADALLFDGTFWSNEDFHQSGISDLPATELLESHLPILNGSLETLAAQRAKHKIYLHLNNTNPRNRSLLMPTRDQVDAAAEVALAARKRLRGVMNILYVLPDYFTGRPKPCMNGWGRKYLTVNPSGLVPPCPTAWEIPELVFDSIREKSLAWIWKESASFNRFRGTEWMSEPCRSCPQREIDFGGCRCQAALLAGDPALIDPAYEFSPHHRLVREAVAGDSKHSPVADLLFRQNPVFQPPRPGKR